MIIIMMPNLHTSSKDGKRRAGDVMAVHGSKPVPTHSGGSTNLNGGNEMNTLTMDLGGVETATQTKNIRAKSIPIVLAISVFAGLLAYLIFRATSTLSAQENQLLLLTAFIVIGFEIVWLAYGAILGILKLFR